MAHFFENLSSYPVLTCYVQLYPLHSCFGLLYLVLSCSIQFISPCPVPYSLVLIVLKARFTVFVCGTLQVTAEGHSHHTGRGA